MYDSQNTLSVPETNMTDQKSKPPQTDPSSEGPLNLLVGLQLYKNEALKIRGARGEMLLRRIVFVNPQLKPRPNLHLGVRFAYTSPELC